MMKRGFGFILIFLSVSSLVLWEGLLGSDYLPVSAQVPLFSPSSQHFLSQATPPQPKKTPSDESSPQETKAAPVRPQEVWRFVYQYLPDFPLENTYIAKETGKVASENTLVGRLIRYHVYVKGRPPNYRFDWKLTLADYLGVTPDYLVEDVYPGADSLQKNPMERDREVIQSLNRAQRDALVQVLVDIFNGNSPQTIPSKSKTPPASTPLPPPKPGDAKLLMP
jgi:hypothetical protein